MFSVSIYNSTKKLITPFKTASGTLIEKEIIQLVFFDSEANPIFAYELPLSPSLGEMPADIKKIIQNNRANAFQVSQHLQRSYSYLKGMLINSFDLLPTFPLKTIRLATYSIGDYENQDMPSHTILRFKCSRDNLDSFIVHTWNLKQEWSVDFNGSLDETSWFSFRTKACLDQCIWIEQPFPVEQFSHRHVINTPVYADEEMKDLLPEEFEKSPYNGFLLKPLRHNFTDTIKWLLYAQECHVPCLIGSVVCDYVGLALCDFFNMFATIQVSSDYRGHFFHPILEMTSSITMENGKIRVNENLFEYIKQHYDLYDNFKINYF